MKNEIVMKLKSRKSRERVHSPSLEVILNVANYLNQQTEAKKKKKIPYRIYFASTSSHRNGLLMFIIFLANL